MCACVCVCVLLCVRVCLCAFVCACVYLYTSDDGALWRFESAAAARVERRARGTPTGECRVRVSEQDAPMDGLGKGQSD